MRSLPAEQFFRVIYLSLRLSARVLGGTHRSKIEDQNHLKFIGKSSYLYVYLCVLPNRYVIFSLFGYLRGGSVLTRGGDPKSFRIYYVIHF